MSEIVYRVAAAICRATGADCPAGRFSDHLKMARAAIEAMREPSPEMLQAGADCLPDMDRAAESYAVAVSDAGDIWEAMLAASLNVRKAGMALKRMQERDNAA